MNLYHHFTNFITQPMKTILPLVKYAYLSFFLLILLMVNGCNKEEETPPRPTDSIVDIIFDTEGLDSLSQIITNFPGLQNRLGSGEYTVFAPNNAAFQKLLQSIGVKRMDDISPGLLNDIALYHVIANDILNANQLDSAATTLNIEQLTFNQGDSIIINQNKQENKTVIVSPNLQAENGVVHVINEVLLPQSLRSIQPYFGTVIGLTSTYFFGDQYGGFSTINNVFSQANLFQTLSGAGPFTVLAPLDATFNSFFSNSLETRQLANYHILEGNINLAEADRTINTMAGEPVYVTNIEGNIFLNGTFAGDFGLEANNGRVIVLGGVLKSAEPLNDIIENAEVLTGANFNLFKTALRETGLQLGENETIFMPTDQAFEEAGLVTSIDSTARLDPAYLTNILQTHVINGINFSYDIVKAKTVQANALNEAPLTISYDENSGSLTVASPETPDAQIVFPDELSTHGVVHVINKVLQP